jgi:dTDP-4-dehydrorhamnose reductase
MKVLVTGAAGMLGWDVCADLTARGHEVIGAALFEEGYLRLDITDTAATQQVVRDVRPDAIINCAAWTDVDGAERDATTAYRVNALGAWNLAYAAGESDCWLLTVSTDFVFDGKRGPNAPPYTEFDETRPLGAYGASKEAGELLVRETLPRRHIIARTAWLYGDHGKNFVYTIRRLARERPEVPVVADQIGCPTYTKDLSRKLIELMENPLPGTYHVCGAGSCSWYEFAQAIVAKSGLSATVVPITAAEYAARFNSPTERPAYSVMRRLALEMRGMDDLPPWEESLDRFLATLTPDR